MTWDFKDQKKVGDKGEKFFLKHWPEPVRKHEELKGPDFVDSRGNVLELKTDTYDLDSTPYFFAERWSDYENKRPGGVWQAHEKGATVFVYFFINNKVWFTFRNLPILLERLETLTEHSYAIRIRNRAWTTTGYKILRHDLAGLYEEWRWDKSTKSMQLVKKKEEK